MDYDTRPDPAKRLQAARERAGFTSATAAAERFSWRYDTYAQHENGTRGITRAAKSYARAFKVSEAWLLTGTGPGPGEHAEEIAILTQAYLNAHPSLRAQFLQTAAMLDLASEALRRSEEAGKAPGAEGDE